MKTSEEDIIFGQDLNEYIWRNGIEKPPRKIKVKMVKSDTGKVTLNLETPIVKKERSEKKKEKVKKENPKKEKETKKKTTTTKKKVETKKKEKEE